MAPPPGHSISKKATVLSFSMFAEEVRHDAEKGNRFYKASERALLGTLFGLGLLPWLRPWPPWLTAMRKRLVPVTRALIPPVEGFLIKSATTSRDRGDTTETSLLLAVRRRRDRLSEPAWFSGGAAVILYEQHLRTVTATLALSGFHGHLGRTAQPQGLQIFGFTPSGTSPAVMLTARGKGGMSNVNYGASSPGENQTGFLTLCPWAGAGTSNAKRVSYRYTWESQREAA